MNRLLLGYSAEFGPMSRNSEKLNKNPALLLYVYYIYYKSFPSGFDTTKLFIIDFF